MTDFIAHDGRVLFRAKHDFTKTAERALDACMPHRSHHRVGRFAVVIAPTGLVIGQTYADDLAPFPRAIAADRMRQIGQIRGALRQFGHPWAEPIESACIRELRAYK